MDMATAAVLIISIVTFSELYRCRVNKDVKKSKKNFDEITEHITQLKKRMANLESITLEKEKQKRFSDLEND